MVIRSFRSKAENGHKAKNFFKAINHTAITWHVLLATLICLSYTNLVSGSITEVLETVEPEVIQTTEYFLSSEPAFDPPPSPPSVRLIVVEGGDSVEILSEESNGTVAIPANKYALNERKDSLGRVLRFYCNATYPVEWIYDGLGVCLST